MTIPFLNPFIHSFPLKTLENGHFTQNNAKEKDNFLKIPSLVKVLQSNAHAPLSFPVQAAPAGFPEASGRLQCMAIGGVTGTEPPAQTAPPVAVFSAHETTAPLSGASHQNHTKSAGPQPLRRFTHDLSCYITFWRFVTGSNTANHITEYFQSQWIDEMFFYLFRLSQKLRFLQMSVLQAVCVPVLFGVAQKV
jgi:hypothetical protein